MRNAWHFYCALVLVIKVVCGDIGIALVHPLTRRYATGQSFLVSSNSLSLAIRFSVSANQHCLLKFLNHLNRKA
ncbi:hypothetical protein CV742_23800, partial [Vibrio parahaemolyticus]|nr:hypothetical protein [Vibrio parahaemolyticus]